MASLNEELFEKRRKVGVTKHVPCTNEANKIYRTMKKRGEKLPVNIFSDDDEHVTFTEVKATSLSYDEIEELMLYRRTLYLRTIRNCVVFFVVITMIPIVFRFISDFV